MSLRRGRFRSAAGRGLRGHGRGRLRRPGHAQRESARKGRARALLRGGGHDAVLRGPREGAATRDVGLLRRRRVLPRGGRRGRAAGGEPEVEAAGGGVDGKGAEGRRGADRGHPGDARVAVRRNIISGRGHGALLRSGAAVPGDGGRRGDVHLRGVRFPDGPRVPHAARVLGRGGPRRAGRLRAAERRRRVIPVARRRAAVPHEVARAVRGRPRTQAGRPARVRSGRRPRVPAPAGDAVGRLPERGARRAAGPRPEPGLERAELAAGLLGAREADDLRRLLRGAQVYFYHDPRGPPLQRVAPAGLRRPGVPGHGGPRRHRRRAPRAAAPRVPGPGALSTA